LPPSLLFLPLTLCSENSGPSDIEESISGMELDEADAATAAASVAAKKIKAAAMEGQNAAARLNDEGAAGEEDDMAKYNMDDYDEEESKSAGALSLFSIHLPLPSFEEHGD
jgi:hypothetical protein